MGEPVLVIMAAGMGSRFGGLKQITSVDREGHSIIDFSLYDAWKAGFRKVVFIIKHEIEADFKRAVGSRMERYFDVRYVFQELSCLPDGFSVPEGRTKPWGTAHAIACAKDAIDGPFAVLNSDDYYGSDAIRLIYDFLREERGPGEHAMVGYRLRNTVTENGYVSRGICSVKGGLLREVVERTHIEKRGGDAAYTEDGQHYTDLPGDTVVSMNLWGFQRELLEQFVEGFPPFLRENLPVNPLKCEYFLPAVVNAQLRDGRGTIRVLPTEDVWHGVTYSEDLQSVMDAIQELKDRKLYSKELWMEPSAAYHFSLDGAPFSVEPCGGDPAGDACLVVTTSGRRYLLQRISGPSGEDGPAEPIRAVPPAGGALKPVPAADGGYCYRDGTGTYRVFHFEEGKA